MRVISCLAVGVSALALSACVTKVDYNGYTAASSNGPLLKAVALLDCPANEGALYRTAQAPDGRSCEYEGWGGETVRLKLVALDGRTATAAMEPTKAELHAIMPIYSPRVPPVEPGEPGEHANIDLPFFHIHTAGDHADVRIFGVKVHSDGENAEVHTNLGLKHTVVHASHDGAEVIAEDVGRTNASMVYVLASEHRALNGYRAVGYVAKGPAAGPLVVGEFRLTRRSQDHEDFTNGGDHGDIGRLIDRNVKG